MEYRAIFSRDSLSHGKFKYIDKWKSKAGKWVYKYAEDVKEGADDIKNHARNLYNFTHRQNVIRPHKRNGESSGNSGGWHTANTADSIAGYSKTRERMTTDTRGRKVRRKEYRSEAENQNANRRVAWANAIRRDRAGTIGGAIMSLNDKYGPKAYDTIEAVDLETGRHYVMNRQKNLFGGRETHVDTYSYNPDEDRVLRKRKKWRKAHSHSANAGTKKGR